MAVSRISFICSDFSYAPKIAYNTTGQLRNYSILEIIKKAMVTGGDELNIDSITVNNKVVRVVTENKSFVGVPGTKFNISGTGVAAIDTRQILTEVYTDGFSFTVDTLNATFTNGLTYSYASLGWQLLDQDANRLLLRSGSGAVTPFNILISREISRDNSYWCLCVYFNYDATSFKDLLLLSPLKQSNEYYIGSRAEGIEEHVSSIYWIYGDDAVVYLAFGIFGGNNFAYTSILNIGECKPLNNSVPVAYMFGRNGDVIRSYDYNDYYKYTSSPFAHSFQGNYVVNGQYPEKRYGDYFAKTGNNYFLSNKCYYYNSYTQTNSGYKSTSFKDTIINSYSFLPTYLLNESFNKIGQIPGLYYLDFNVSLINPTHKNFVSYKTTLNNKAKTTVVVKASSQNDTSNVGNTSTVFFMLDLTGPIR